jgi:anti-sigma factor RsiW
MDEMRNDWTDMLSEFLDDSLSEEQRAALEDRLQQDAALRRTLEELRAVKNLAGSLPNTEPTSDLWPGIASRIDVVVDPAVVPLVPRRRASPSRFAFTVPQLAAAAIVMVLLGGSLMYAVQQGSANVSPEVTATTAEPGASNGVPIGVPVFTGATAKYETAIRELEDGLAAGRSSLDPETVRVIEASLAKIDVAIEEARTALKADPASEYLSRHLTGAMTRKLDVLLQANELVRAQT